MVALVNERIDREALVCCLRQDSDGAIVTFDGVTRNHSRGKAVLYLVYEAYESMALKQMYELRDQARQRWPITDMALIHRLGRLEIGESSVFVAVTSPHRRAAFEACQFGIDTLKRDVPIWKKEFYADGEAWIEGQE
ncbi:MAG: molybdenum cofactor biosynthesis protein MoaE [Acidobacteria bacterium]|nr:molybdenum cofactor biosynthesis protein MoaE [Acidobacteriota bacterium]MBI3656450.1 molybdenum cofactor biosynthesis protein MoaE [Acidobacteriota bacterium]